MNDTFVNVIILSSRGERGYNSIAVEKKCAVNRYVAEAVAAADSGGVS